MVCTTKLTLVLAELIHHLSDPSRDSSKDEDARHFLGFRHDGNAKNTVWTDGRVLCCAVLCCNCGQCKDPTRRYRRDFVFVCVYACAVTGEARARDRAVALTGNKAKESRTIPHSCHILVLRELARRNALTTLYALTVQVSPSIYLDRHDTKYLRRPNLHRSLNI